MLPIASAALPGCSRREVAAISANPAQTQAAREPVKPSVLSRRRPQQAPAAEAPARSAREDGPARAARSAAGWLPWVSPASSGASSRVETALTRAADLVTERDPSAGSPNAPVTAVIFGDLQCPFTGRAVATLGDLRQRYGDDRLRVVWKNYPLASHRRAEPAAEAAAAVHLVGGSGAFWSFSGLVLGARDDLSDGRLEKWAADAGVAVPTYRWLRGDGSDEVKAKVEEDIRLAERVGVSSVPHVFINDRQIVGAEPIEEFASAIDDALAAAEGPSVNDPPAGGR